MDHAALSRLLDSRRPGHTLPQAFYNSPAVFEADMALLFHREWLFAGHGCEIPRTGDYLTHRVGNAEAIITRGPDGVIRAFHNSCRHRGSRICTAERGVAVRLVCPYHQWSYGLDGRLRFAREMGPDFKPEDHGLKPVHCETIGGYIFLCFAEQAPDFAAFRAQAEPYMTPHVLEDAKLAHMTRTIEKGNWKLVWENNRECYHCPGSHPSLNVTFSDNPAVGGVLGADADPDMLAHTARCEAAGLPSAFTLSEDGQHRVVRVPLLRDTESFTLTGKIASQRPLGGIETPQIGSMLLFHYPTTWNHLLRDHATSFCVTPLGPEETLVTTKWLVHKDAVEGVDYDVQTLTEVWQATNEEDRRLVEQNQLGVGSLGYTPGPYAPAQESGVAQFVDWYCAALGRQLAAPGLRVAAE